MLFGTSNSAASTSYTRDWTSTFSRRNKNNVKKAAVEDGQMMTDDHRHSVTERRASFATAVSIHVAYPSVHIDIIIYNIILSCTECIITSAQNEHKQPVVVVVAEATAMV